ncbi:uncharacterized protein [Triticum aestivum]|uniref:uncharacterized protein n=1 Tax=Triticum aestivum TaxID=4565 RepID=UPI001D0220DE|nr:uncharacterized protein LOC123153104 [Triticum aestivum]
MLHEKPVQIGQLSDDGNGTNKAWTGEKRRRKHVPPSSSDAPTTAQDHGDMEVTILGGGDPFLHATDMELLPKIDSEDLPFDMTWEEEGKIKVRLARLRITYYKALKPECARERELKEPEEYTDAELGEELYFKRLEEDKSFDWFVHPDDTYKAGLNDYQRIAPRNFLHHSGRNLYRYHDEYRSCYHTYKIVVVYVKYYAEISKKIKWITEYLHLDRSTEEWIELDTRASRQALRIATDFANMTVRLAAFAYNEYILEMDKNASLKDIDLLYFEIWRRVTKKNLSYMDAVKEVYEMDKFDVHKRRLDGELKGVPAVATIKQYMHYVVRQGGIDAKTKEDKARDVFRKLSVSMHKAMNMAQYAQKKLDLADELKLDKEGESTSTPGSSLLNLSV